MEQKSDLRVTKTRRLIKATFLELVQAKPVQKITVTELAKRAEISKGTFYLHYLDIYDLYNQMVEETVAKIAGSFDPYPDLFSAPESFVRTFLFSQVEPLGLSLSAGERTLLTEKNMQSCSRYPQYFLDAFKEHIYQVGVLARCEENGIKIDFLLTGMLSIVIQYRPLTAGDQKKMDFIVQFLSLIIRDTFPEFYRS
ncbi:TetR/AcrR family transcriptional regulator [Flavonifractor sp. An10]|uniref:TetR/AcrR family transcriptional regulator n=1 Tax=Flavonifractor sp. An10 TaxID=1965537 RepID=UPI000B38B26E|nr:TetR/AcrR family transcriptional regulator [Flavonifractor sp. An10]OUQ81851.1 hypothetical protein B5E42_09815 [Flavonifractor sp. An10]